MIDRYSRQALFPGIGEEGQKKLGNSSVVIIGCGALGTIIATSLVRAGVGKIRIMDRDFIEYHNLQRQVLFNEEDIKAELPKTTIEVKPDQGPDSRDYSVSFDKIKKGIPEFKPEWTLEKGVHDLVQRLSKIPLTKELFESAKLTRLKTIRELVSAGSLDSKLYWKR